MNFAVSEGRKSRKRRLIVLGAGASYAVGLPDGDRVLSHLTLYVNGPFGLVRNRTPMRGFADIWPALFTYATRTGFRHGDRFPLDTVIQQFYDAARQDPRAIETLNLLWLAICEFIYSRSCECAEGYIPFAQMLGDQDVVLSFNWDVCLEIARRRLGRSMALNWIRKPDNTPWLFKPHGSVDFIVAGPGPVPGVGPRDECIEDIHPQLPVVVTSQGRLAPKLARIRTYDLSWEVETDWANNKLSLSVNPHAYIDHATVEPDVGPLHLRRFFPDSGPFLLTPGGSPIFYGWSYARIQEAIAAVADEIAGIWVVGYSFPRYDTGVLAFLREIAQSIGDVPVHIVNPAANDLPEDVLRGVFGSVTRHPVGFLEFAWEPLAS